MMAKTRFVNNESKTRVEYSRTQGRTTLPSLLPSSPSTPLTSLPPVLVMVLLGLRLDLVIKSFGIKPSVFTLQKPNKSILV